MSKGATIPSKSSRSSIAQIFGEFITEYPRHFGLLFFILLFEGIVAMAAVLAIVPLADFLVDPFLESPSRVTRMLVHALGTFGFAPGFWIFGLFFVTANIAKGLLGTAARIAILRIKYTVMRGLFGGALTAFFRARWEFFSGAKQGRLLNTLNRELANIGDTLGHLATELATAVQLCIYLIVPIWLNARMTFTALGLAIVLASPLLLLQRISYRLGQRNTETANVATGVLTEILGAARLILGFGRQVESRNRFLSAFDQHVRVTLRSQIVADSIAALFQPIAILSAVIALGVALRYGTRVAEMAALLWSLLRALPLLGTLISTKISISNFLPSYEQLVSLRDQAERLKEVEGNKPFMRLEEGVELRDIDFTYVGRHHTLRQINLSIRKGQTTALVGESGSGKSTITDLVLGLQIPGRGEVLIDGIPLGEWRQTSFRERVGYVPQDPLLFHASIRDNLLWSNPEAEESELWNACRMANAERFVRQLPEGIDTVVGDRGVRLSAGQRQRIALARALLRKPELLILDEATSALDSESERLIQESINELAREATLLVIAHRLSTIVRADYAYVLSDGSIVEQGPYAELSTRRGGYLAAMIALQQSREATGAAQ